MLLAAFRDLLIWRFRRVPVPDSFRRILASGEPITLVTHTDSLIMEALLTALARSAGAPDPVHIRAALAAAPTTPQATPPLTWTSVKNSDLLARWHTLDPRRQFSSVNLFHVRGPVKNHPSYQTGVRAMWRLLLGAPFMFIIFGDPLSAVAAGVTEPHAPALRPGERLARIMKLDFYRNHKIIRGTPLQPIQSQAAQILHGHDFERELQIIAQRSGKDLERVRQQAFDEFYRMAANPRRIMYGIVAPISQFMLRRLFTNIRTFGIERLAAAVREHPVVLVPMHRSHLDYVLLGTTLYHLNLNPPLVAAGVNLSFWPFGSIIRSLGGYFVKRDARHDRIHAMLLRRYVQYLLKRGHLQEFFIEGGRSRSGRMRAPKVGLLNIIVEAFMKRARKDVLFVPVSLTYEQLIEDKVFGDENTGKSKQKEDLRSLVKARSIFRKQYGEVIMTFGEPVSLAKYCELSGTGASASAESGAPERSKPSEQRAIVIDLARHLTRTIRDNTHLTLTGLAHTALLNAPRYGLTRNHLNREIVRLSKLAAATLHGNALNSSPHFTTSLQRFLEGTTGVIDDLLAGGIIHMSTVVDQEVFFIPGNKRFSADFYKNSVLHFYWLAGLASILELRDEVIRPESIQEFYQWFGSEFFVRSPEQLQEEFDSTLRRLHEAGLISKAPGGYRTEPSARELCSPTMLLSLFESHLWVLRQLRALIQNGAATEKDGRFTVPYATLGKRLTDEFRPSGYLGVMTRTEASSQTNIQAVLDCLTVRKLLTSQGEGSKREISFVAPQEGEIEALAKIQELVLAYQVHELGAAAESIATPTPSRSTNIRSFSHLN